MLSDPVPEADCPDLMQRLGNCPKTYYFPPQRESLDGVVISSNSFIIPEMRLCSMSEWAAEISEAEANRIQFRYDELNRRTLDRVDSGPVDFGAARELITYLRPPEDVNGAGPNPDYYSGPKGGEPARLIINGSVSVMDLKNLVIECHFGYYCDKWVRISLPNYLGGSSGK